MKRYTHAWLAFMATKRLEHAKLSPGDKSYAEKLVKWLKDHRDDVIQGAWYPDAVYKDMGSSHVLKMTPLNTGKNTFKNLPGSYYSFKHGKKSDLYKKSFVVEKNDNLPDRCESIAHNVIDQLKIQYREKKGSPVSPTYNLVALMFYALSHYVADAHVPFHCDSRKFSSGEDIHGYVEKKWEDEIKKFYDIDKKNKRFYYDPWSYPLRKTSNTQDFENSYLKKVGESCVTRDFIKSWGTDNNNVWDFMSAICQYSFLLSYGFIPKGYDHGNVTKANFDQLGEMDFDDLSLWVMSDAIDSIVRIWLRLWIRYTRWKN